MLRRKLGVAEGLITFQTNDVYVVAIGGLNRGPGSEGDGMNPIRG
jgi:hypothetical protein